MTTVVYLESVLTPHLRRVESRHGSIQVLAPDWQIPYVAFLDGKPVLRADWELVPEDNQSLAFIEISALPQGGGGGGSDALRVVLIIAVMVMAPQIGVLMGPGMFGAGVMGLSAATWSAAVSMVGVALVNALIPPPKPTTPQQQAALAAPSPTYSLQAQGNMGRLDSAIPEHFGRMVAYPDFAAKPYSEYSGNEQYVYELLCVGRGYYDIEAYRIEDTPMDNFDDITREVIPPGGSVTLFPTNVISSSQVAGQELVCFGATYNQPASTVVTVTKTAHGLANGSSIYLETTTGTLPSGDYTVVSVPTADTFTVSAALATTSGGVTVSSWFGGFMASASGQNANYLGLDVVASKGLFYANDDGSLSPMSAYVSFEARTVDAVGTPTSGWVSLTAGSVYSAWSSWTYQSGTGPGAAASTALIEYTNTIGDPGYDQYHYYNFRTRILTTGTVISGATTTPQRVSWRYPVTLGRYEVRGRRTDIANTASRVGHSIVWAGLRAYMPDTRVYGDVTLIALRMRASNNLSSRASTKVNVIATRKLPIWNGSSWSALTATRSPAMAFAYACKQAGLSDAQIDLAGLLALEAITTGRSDYFDGRFDNFLGYWEALSKIAGAVRAKPFMQGGVMRVVRDQASSIPVAMFSVRNIVKGSFGVTYLMPTAETADVVDVKYFDSTSWSQASVRADLLTPAARAALILAGTSPKPAKVDLFGVTSRAQAYREGLYQAASNRYRRKIIKFKTEMEGFIPSLGDLIAIQHDMPAWGQGGEVTNWVLGTLTATLSEAVTWGAGTHYIAFRKRDGSMDGPYTVTLGLSAHEVVLGSAPVITPYTGGSEERTHYMFGWGTTWQQPARLLSAKPSGQYTVDIEAVGEDSNVHTADTGVTTPALVTTQLSGYTNAPIITGLAAHPVPFSQTKMSVSWNPSQWADHYYVEQSLDSGLTWTRMGDVQTNNFIIEIQRVSTKIRVAALGIAKGSWTELDIVIPPPPAFDTFLVSAQPDGTRQYNFGYFNLNTQPFNWKGAEIRYIAGIVPSPDWNLMTPLQDSTTFYTSSPIELNAPLSGTYTFAARSTDLLNQSSSLSVRSISLPDRRLGNVFDEFYEMAEGWLGTLTGCHIQDGILQANDTTTWATLPATWAAWARWNTSPTSPISYVTPVRDFLTVVAGQFNPTVDADGTIVLEIATSVDGSTWSAWGSASASFSTRYFKARLTVTATVPFPVPVIRDFHYLINAPIKSEYINDKVISTLTGSYRIGVGDIRIPLVNTYTFIKRTSIVVQDNSAGTWTYVRIDQALTYGPRWQFRLNGVLADPQFVDFFIEGF